MLKLFFDEKNPIRHQLHSLTQQGSRDFETLKLGCTLLVWGNIYWNFENLKTFEVFVKESAY